jgi:ribosomal protein S18 acetylase RimI-like enzyme
MPIDIRRLHPSDAEDYRAIRLAALQGAPEAFGSVHAVEAARPLSDFAERLDATMVFGAYDAGRIIGMVGFAREDGPKDRHKGYVWGMYVRPEAQGQGVGAALLQALLAAAAGVVEQVKLMVVADNAGAIALYRKLGFVTYGVEPRALKTEAGYFDEMLMVRML